MEEAQLDQLTELLEKFKHSERYCQDFFESGKENYKLYKSYKDSGEKVYKHDIFVPYPYAYLEDMTSYFMLSILASPVLYSFERRMRAISPELARQLEQVVDWVVKDEEAELALELEEVLKNVGIYNVGYLINYPVVEERRVAAGMQMNLFGGSTTKRTFRRLHVDAACPLDIFIEPNVKRISRMGYVFKRAWENMEQLKKWEKEGRFGYKNVEEAKGGIQEDNPIVQRLQEIGIGSVDQYYDKKTDKVELLDYLHDGNVITIGGRRAIIRDTSKDLIKPFDVPIPILDCRLGGAPGEYFGLHTIESIKELAKELNTIRSQRRDNVSLLLNKVFILDLLAGEVDLNTLFSAPGNVITGTNIKEALDELDISDVTASSYKETQELQFDLQNTTSLWDYARGGTPRRRETATGIIRLQQAAQSRNEWLLRKFDFYVLQPLARRIVMYLHSNMDPKDFDDIIGPDSRSSEFFSLDSDDLRRMLQVQPLTESITSVKEVNLNQLIQAFDRLIQLPEVNRAALVKQLLLRLGQKDIKEILPQLSGMGQEAAMEGMDQLAGLPQIFSAAQGGGMEI